MRPVQLYEYYPTLYHIAWGGSWRSIQKYGLLSSKDLLRSYGKRGDEFKTLTQVRRECWVKVNCLGRPSAILRDQKPLNEKKLKKALPKNVEPWQWYDLINSMVFFWPTKKRLKSMISAKVYSELYHDVLLGDTKKLVEL